VLPDITMSRLVTKTNQLVVAWLVNNLSDNTKQTTNLSRSQVWTDLCISCDTLSLTQKQAMWFIKSTKNKSDKSNLLWHHNKNSAAVKQWQKVVNSWNIMHCYIATSSEEDYVMPTPTYTIQELIVHMANKHTKFGLYI